MKDTQRETLGLLVIMKAKLGKEQEVNDFLVKGRALVDQEPQTVSWFAFQIDERTFGIYDTFAFELGRQAHLNGAVAKALLANANELLENFDANRDIQPIRVIASNHKQGIQNKGLLVRMKAKTGKSKAVESFLGMGRQLVADESGTLSWYALRLDETTYAIFDTFAENTGRDAHLNGEVAKSLMENATVNLENFKTSDIQKIDILASK
ncbi:MAG: hypothetical protein AAF361_00440 [Bacteroidota bacterium]